jgi:hypothetical protein
MELLNVKQVVYEVVTMILKGLTVQLCSVVWEIGLYYRYLLWVRLLTASLSKLITLIGGMLVGLIKYKSLKSSAVSICRRNSQKIANYVVQTQVPVFFNIWSVVSEAKIGHVVDFEGAVQVTCCFVLLLVLDSLTFGPIFDFYCTAYSDISLGCAQRSTMNGQCHGKLQFSHLILTILHQTRQYAAMWFRLGHDPTRRQLRYGIVYHNEHLATLSWWALVPNVPARQFYNAARCGDGS